MEERVTGEVVWCTDVCTRTHAGIGVNLNVRWWWVGCH